MIYASAPEYHRGFRVSARHRLAKTADPATYAIRLGPASGAFACQLRDTSANHWPTNNWCPCGCTLAGQAIARAGTDEDRAQLCRTKNDNETKGF